MVLLRRFQPIRVYPVRAAAAVLTGAFWALVAGMLEAAEWIVWCFAALAALCAYLSLLMLSSGMGPPASEPAHGERAGEGKRSLELDAAWDKAG